jgi:hypothetical protein
MNEDKFWEIISLFDWDKAGDDLAVMQKSIEELSNHTEQEIYEFEKIMTRLLFQLDLEEYAKHSGRKCYGNDDFAEDEFLFARACVVANGKDFYDKVKLNPEEFPKNLEFAALLNLANLAWFLKTGTKTWNYIPELSYETYSNQEQWNGKESPLLMQLIENK